MYHGKQLKSTVFGVSIVIVILMFVSFDIDSHAAAERWKSGFFSSFGLNMGYKSIEHTDDLIDAIYDSSVNYQGSSFTLMGRAGRVLSQKSAVYLPISFTFVNVDYVGIGMMLRPRTDSTLFFFGDIGVVPIGGPFGLSAGIGFDISRFTIDVSGLVGGGGNGQTAAAMVTLSYLWSR